MHEYFDIPDVLTLSKEEKDVIESFRLRVNGYLVKSDNFESFGKAFAWFGLYRMILNKNANSL